MIKTDYNNIFRNKKLFFLGVFIAISAAFLDIFTKKLIFHILDQQSGGYEGFYIEITNFFNLVKVWNRGVSFGMFSDVENSQIIFSAIVSSITLIMLIWLYRNDKPYLMIAIALIIGGALGNLSDRITNGAVADFLDFHIANYHWPAFNLADSFVFIGVFMLILEDLFLKKQK